MEKIKNRQIIGWTVLYAVISHTYLTEDLWIIGPKCNHFKWIFQLSVARTNTYYLVPTLTSHIKRFTTSTPIDDPSNLPKDKFTTT